MKIKEIPINISDYLKYDETSATFLRWKKLSSTCCRNIKVWDEAGSLYKSTGYYCTKFNNIRYQNHRIVYFLCHGYCPDIVDHIDRNRQNNNINNLREATLQNNQHNRTINKNNKTGIKGLSILRKTYWHLKIQKNGKQVFQEYHKLTEKTKEECRIILENKRKELHGNFSNNG